MTETIPTRPAAQNEQEDSSGDITCRVFKDGQTVEGVQRLHEIGDILQNDDHIVWLDMVDPGPADLELLQTEFGLHPLAIEDAAHAHERPKIESYGDTWFLVVQGTTVTTDSVTFHEIAIFVSERYLVTVRHDPPFPFEEVEERWRAHMDELRTGSGFLLYTILDTVVDGYLPVAQQFEDRVDALEEELFRERRMQHDVLPRIFRMKKDAQRFRWAVLPMRDILNPIIREDIKILSPETIVYFRDVYDHAVRVIDQLDTLRDLMGSALEIHLSVVSNRHNEVAKQLTIIATIFLPLTYITGFFGQNFALLVGTIAPRWAFWALGIGLELMTVALTIGYFKWRHWF